MKNFSAPQFLLALLLIGFSSLASQAQTIRRVSLTTTGTNIYATFALAQAAAATGDIVQMEPGTYGFDILLTKNLTVVGPGYFLGSNQNPNLQANSQEATVNLIHFSTGSTGASVSGITASTAGFSADGVTLQRCRITSIAYFNYNSVAVNNINIRQNYLSAVQHNQGQATTNLLFTNNIVTGYLTMGANDNGEIRNNVFNDPNSYPNTFYNANVVNNYFGYQYSSPSLTNCTVTYNAFRYPSQPTTGNNLNNVVPSAVFALAPGTTQFDAWFQLKTGTNVLRSAGENGTDIGAFGGGAPYRLGGLPAIPAIYQLSNSVNGNTLNVNLSTRSNN